MTISEKEAKIYDRQIRLWGVHGQERLRNARLLIVGVKGLSTEIVKNLVLAGVGTLCVMDHNKVEGKDLGCNYFRAKSSCKRIQELNPLVKVLYNENYIRDQNEKFYENFDIVLLTNCDIKTQMYVNDECRKKNVMFFAADTFGFLGICFQDLLKFQYETKKKGKKKESHTIDYKPLRAVLETDKEWSKFSRAFLGIQLLQEYFKIFESFPSTCQELTKYCNGVYVIEKNLGKDAFSQDYLERLVKNARANVNHVCSVVGGIISQEVIKAICADSKPIDNFFIYDGLETFSGIIEKL